MRFHYTLAFSEARKKYDAAIDAYDTFDDTGDNARQLEQEASDLISAADPVFFNAEARTPFEIQAKLEAASKRAQNDFDIRDYYSLDAMRLDLGRLQRLELSPGFASPWATWRKVHSEIEANGADAPSGIFEGQTWEEFRAGLYCEIVMKDCTTPGDFILKRYLSLLTQRGSCDTAVTRADMTANPWDIHISDFEGEARFDHADALGTYCDLDNCDLGMNLLAYGQPHFDAEAWMEAADRVGHRVQLIQQPDGSWAFWSEVGGDDYPTERIRRERDRLMRLLNFPGLERHRLIADEMRREWPQLVRATPSATTDVVECAPVPA